MFADYWGKVASRLDRDAAWARYGDMKMLRACVGRIKDVDRQDPALRSDEDDIYYSLRTEQFNPSPRQILDFDKVKNATVYALVVLD